MDPFFIWVIVAGLVWVGIIIYYLVKEADYSKSFGDFLDADALWGYLAGGLGAGILWPLIAAGLILVSPFYLIWKLNHTKAKLAKSDPPVPPQKSPTTYKEHMEYLRRNRL